jgi:hypothetical protein
MNRRARSLVGCGIVALSASSCATTPQGAGPTTGPGYGESRGAAIEVCQTAGERTYLSRLVCANGDGADFDRLGTPGTRHELPADQSVSEQISSSRRDPLSPGEVDYHAVDAYEVSCGTSKRVLYLDMYHCHQPEPAQAPPGYSLK